MKTSEARWIGAVAAIAFAGCQQASLRSLTATPEFQCLPADGGAAIECATLDFGDVPVGTGAALDVDLADLGTATLLVSGSGWTPNSDPQFSDELHIASVNGGGHALFTVTFSPVQLGAAMGTFFVQSSNGTKTQVELAVTGTGVGMAQAAVSPPSIAFGNILQNTTASRIVTLSNTGNVDLSVLSAAVQGATAFGVSTSSTMTVTAASTATMTVTYSPTGPEMDTGTLIVKAVTLGSATGAIPQSLSVMLTGESEPVMVVTPTALDFGDVVQGVSTPKVVTVQNEGKADLQLTTTALATGSSMYFSASSPATPPVTLHPGDTDLITVVYDTVGKITMTPDTGTLDLAGSDPVTPSVDVPLNGACPTCANIPDPGCNTTYPHRLWPSGADVQTCSEGSSTLNTTGPGAENWFDYAGCGDQRDFTTKVGSPISISSWGDGCACPGCELWHIDYQLRENTGGGFQTEQTVQAQDSVQCPATGGTTNTTVYTPLTTDVRMDAQFDTTGIGFYFAVCSQ